MMVCKEKATSKQLKLYGGNLNLLGTEKVNLEATLYQQLLRVLHPFGSNNPRSVELTGGPHLSYVCFSLFSYYVQYLQK